MPRSNFVVGLVNTFNLNNYFSDRINTNFTVEGRKIVGLFAYGTDVAKYLRRVGEEIIKQQYLGKEVVAGRYYDLNCFPFVLGANPSKKESDIEGVMKVELADSANKGVIRNLKIHLVNEFRVAVTLKVIARLVEEARITEEEGYEWVRYAVKIGAFDGSNHLRKDYLYCIAFDGEYFEREGYDSETFELFKGMYIQEFNSRLEECGLKNSDFYHYKDDMLYIKDVDEKVVKRVAKYVKERVALSFDTPGKEDSKIENLKDVLGSLIFKWTGKSIGAYGYDIFTDEREREDGNGFALIPLIGTCNGQLETLKRKDMYEINAKHKNLISDIKGKTAKPDVTNCKSSVYAISNKGIAQLLPEIMQFPIAYNKRFEHFEFAADLGPSSSVRSPRHVSSVSSPVPLSQPGTEATVVAVPGVQEFLNGDIDNEKEPSAKLSQMELESPQRDQGKELNRCPRLESEEGGLQSSGYQLSTQLSFTKVSGSQSQQSVSVAYNVQAGTNTQPQQMNPSLQQGNVQLANPRSQSPCLLQGTHENKWSQSLQPGPSGLSQPMDPRSSPAPSGDIPGFLLSTQVDSRVSSKSGSGSPKKHEALQSESSSSKCADELEQGASGGFSASSKSSGEYEEDRAKNESPKRHGILCKLKSLLSSKSDQPDENFERHDVRRSSTQSAPVPRVSKKPPVSKQRSFPGRGKAQSNPPSEVSSPAHLKDTSWQLSEVIVKSAPAEDKGRLLKPEAPIRKISTGSQKSDDSGFKSSGPSPQMSLTKSKPNLWLGAGDEELSSSLPGLNNTLEPSVKSKPFSLPRASLVNKAPTSSSTQKLPTQSGGHVVTPSRPPGKLDSPKVEEQKQQVSEQKSVW
ncbi:MAG: hypothetical protein LKM45_03520 [Wolbachia endosymbiont of Alcedoecus sp.]|nr:hypothetical protein [Wolbachia endosymbiont of Alcedoecus sp.]